MASTSDYPEHSFQANDPDFKILTRQGQVIATPLLMPTPVRGAGDNIFVVPTRLAGRWDMVAYEAMGDVSYRHVLMRHNRIEDPFSGPKAGDRLLIPTADQIKYYLSQ